MPFSKTSKTHTESYWTSFFKDFLQPVITKFGYQCERSKALPTNLVKNIIHDLHEADLVVAVLTDFNANVWYELGIRHSHKPGTVMLIEKGQKPPFDINQYGVIQYVDGISTLMYFEAELQNFITHIEQESMIDNPVLEFLNEKTSRNDDHTLVNFDDLDWKKAFTNCSNLDIHVHYFDTFIRTHNQHFKNIFERGGKVRLILPNYENDEVVQVILRRFPEYTFEEIRTKIKQTKHKIETIQKSIKGKKKGVFRCYFVNEVGYYCGLKFDETTLILSIYDHIREGQRIDSPSLICDLRKNLIVGKWFNKEFNGLLKRQDRMADNTIRKAARITSAHSLNRKAKLIFDKFTYANGKSGIYGTVESKLLKEPSGSILVWAKVTDDHNQSPLSRNRYILGHSTHGGQSMKPDSYVYANVWSISRKTFKNSNQNAWCFWTTNSKGEGNENTLSSQRHLSAGWHLFGIVWSKKNNLVKFYIDENLEVEGNCEFWPVEYDANIFVGTWPNRFTNHYFDSTIGPIYGYNHQLEVGEITELFQNIPKE